MIFDKSILDTIFKSYDIRGIYPEQINEDFAYAFGRAFASVMKVKEVAVGRDARLSSEVIFSSLTKGIIDQGANVIDLGMVTTDMVYFTTGKYQFESGIMITASHNPKEYNGFKACLKNAVAISYNAGFEKIKNIILEDDFENVSDIGKIIKKDIYEDWIDFVLSFVDIKCLQKQNLVVDAGNGVIGLVWDRLAERLPQLNIHKLYFEPDGNFPNHLASPIEEENLVDLKGTMEQLNFDLGMAFDGDGDRVFLVDDKYQTISGTLMTAMISKMLLEKDPNSTILYNAICGRVVPEVIKKNHGLGVRVQVGHSLIKEDMKKYQAIFAGEHSGHYFFKDNWNADSGIIASLIMLEFISKSKRKLSEIRKEFDIYFASGEINFKVSDTKRIIEKIQNFYTDLKQDSLDGISIYNDKWWANIRPSNTEPLLRLNVEADSEDILKEKIKEISDLIVEQEK